MRVLLFCGAVAYLVQICFDFFVRERVVIACCCIAIARCCCMLLHCARLVKTRISLTALILFFAGRERLFLCPCPVPESAFTIKLAS